jgi:hypothetical protein
MTYRFISQTPIGLAWFRPSHAGNPALNDYFTLTVGATNDLGITGSGTTTLTFPPGTYHIRATLGGDKSAAADYIDFQWEIDSSLVGNVGGWDTSTSKKMTCEYSEYAFTASSSASVRLKCVAVSGTTTITANVSGMIVRGAQ